MSWRQNPWSGDYKIPWNEAGFSRRMLAEHLTQAHDHASRRLEWIDRQTAWIHETILRKQPARVLDLGCGPGLYAHRLAALGHVCHGIDFGPASIEYARQHTSPGARCTFTLGDMRQEEFGGPYDLAMILFGEMNTFSPDECRSILGKARGSLTTGGRLLIELERAEGVFATGHGAVVEYESESGLFCDGPHRCRIECHWLDELGAAVRVHRVVELASGVEREYRNTTQAWSDERFTELLMEQGFERITRHSDWPNCSGAFVLWSGEARG